MIKMNALQRNMVCKYTHEKHVNVYIYIGIHKNIPMWFHEKYWYQKVYEKRDAFLHLTGETDSMTIN